MSTLRIQKHEFLSLKINSVKVTSLSFRQVDTSGHSEVLDAFKFLRYPYPYTYSLLLIKNKMFTYLRKNSFQIKLFSMG